MPSENIAAIDFGTMNCSVAYTMASIGDVRKTSNGCEVAKHVPRKESGFRINSENIAAIYFGTTNCSLAYITVGAEGLRLLPLNTVYHRVPTAIH